MLEVYAQELATAEILSVWSYFLASDCERSSILLSEASLLIASAWSGEQMGRILHSAGSYTLVYTITTNTSILQLSAATVMQCCLETAYMLINFVNLELWFKYG